ncbi:MAG: nucleoside-diphosphate kinase [Planctomycetia bacterium]|nr:MAG: nucleoside-diphosphate kinase [Planctomycetia bacterium]
MERTLIIVKPDAVQRGLIGRLLARFEDKGLRIIGMRLQKTPDAIVARHYEVHKDRPFYKSLVGFMTSGPVVVAAIEGPQAITVVRTMLGATDGRQAAPGTIRGDFGIDKQFNLVHASDGPETAKFELELFFKPEELVSYTRASDAWIVSN